MSLQTRDPPSLDDDDIDVDLPTEAIELNPMGVVDINFFSLRIGLAIIQGQIYKRLSSTKALKHSELERSLAAKELNAILETWKRSVPIGFSNLNTNTALESSLPTLLHTIVLKFTTSTRSSPSIAPSSQTLTRTSNQPKPKQDGNRQASPFSLMISVFQKRGNRCSSFQ
jgi:hypothetical protein